MTSANLSHYNLSSYYIQTNFCQNFLRRPQNLKKNLPLGCEVTKEMSKWEIFFEICVLLRKPQHETRKILYTALWICYPRNVFFDGYVVVGEV